MHLGILKSEQSILTCSFQHKINGRGDFCADGLLGPTRRAQRAGSSDYLGTPFARGRDNVWNALGTEDTAFEVVNRNRRGDTLCQIGLLLVISPRPGLPLPCPTPTKD